MHKALSDNDVVSIHALVRVRLSTTANATGLSGFNPRTRESATGDVYKFRRYLKVSIHALVRVRRARCLLHTEGKRFQSTHS